MDSDDEAMEEPPSDYYQTRRRSNTLPTEILRHLRGDRQGQKRKDVQEDEKGDTDDEPDGGEVCTNHRSGLCEKLKKVTISDRDSNDSSKVAKKSQRKGNHQTSTSPSSHRVPITSYDDDLFSRKHCTKQLTNHRVDQLTNNLIRAVSDDTLVAKRRRKPLPRGSNVYEKALEDFGHNEEDRDLVSPLPSPQILRRSRHSAKHAAHSDVTHHVGSSSPSRHVHWGEEVRNVAVNKR